jgi:hypothetical protein
LSDGKKQLDKTAIHTIYCGLLKKGREPPQKEIEGSEKRLNQAGNLSNLIRIIGERFLN